MGIEKPEGPGSSESKSESSVEEKDIKRKKLLQDALQESYELNYSKESGWLNPDIEDEEHVDDDDFDWVKFKRSACYKNLKLSKEKGIELDNKQAFQKTFNEGLQIGWIKRVNELSDFAKENGIEVVITQEAVQKGYEKALSQASLEEANELSDFAKENGIEVVITQEAVQKGYEKALSQASLEKANELSDFAKENGIEVVITKKENGIEVTSNPEMVQKAYQNRFNELLNEGKFFKIEDFFNKAKEQGIELNISKEALQNGHDRKTAEGWSNDVKEIINFAKEHNIEIKTDVAKEDIYIKAIHNTGLGHAKTKRMKLLDELHNSGSDITYEEVINMDYLDYLEIPEEQRLNIVKTVELDGVPMNARFYGQKQEAPVQGKFIIGINPDNTLEFVSDSTLGEHRDIAGKYDLEIIGGGWLEIDEQSKKVKIYESSQDFGYEPRSISKQVVADTFSGFEVVVED